MRLTVREAAQRLQVPEEVVYKFIRDRGLPAVKFNEQYRINSVELAEWAQENRVTLLPEAPLFPQLERSGSGAPQSTDLGLPALQQELQPFLLRT